jgi:hypothetical protein
LYANGRWWPLLSVMVFISCTYNGLCIVELFSSLKYLAYYSSDVKRQTVNSWKTEDTKHVVKAILLFYVLWIWYWEKQELDPTFCAGCILDSYRSSYTGFNQKDVRVDEKPQIIVICKKTFPLIWHKTSVDYNYNHNHE